MIWLALKNSIGNVIEIMDLLDADEYNKTQIAEHYKWLVDKWGEWNIVGGESLGVALRYVNIKNAMFSGLAITFMTLTVVCLSLAIIVGKILLPRLAKYYDESNDSMVDIATLRTNAEICKKENETQKDKKEWF